MTSLKISAACVRAIHEIVYYLRVAMHSRDRCDVCVTRICELSLELADRGRAIGLDNLGRLTSIVSDGAEKLRTLHHEELASVIERSCFAITLLLKKGSSKKGSTDATIAALEEGLRAELRAQLTGD
jgi:hypothetical protein